MNIASLMLLSTVIFSVGQQAVQTPPLRLSLSKPPGAFKVGDTPIIEVDIWNDSDSPIYIDWRDSEITGSVVYGSYDEDSVPFRVEGSFHGVSHPDDPVGTNRAKHATVIPPRQVKHSKAVLSEIEETPSSRDALRQGKIRVILTTKLMNTSNLGSPDTAWSESKLKIEFPLVIIRQKPE